MLAHSLEPADQNSQASGVEELDLLHVDDDVATTGIDQLSELFTELGRGVDVYFADGNNEYPVVASAAYSALREVARKPAQDAVAKKMWPTFPQAEPKDLTEKGLPGLRERVKTWWSAWLAERQAEK